MEMSNSRSYWLMINSNSGGCSTGGSTDFAPFRISLFDPQLPLRISKNRQIADFIKCDLTIDFHKSFSVVEEPAEAVLRHSSVVIKPLDERIKGRSGHLSIDSISAHQYRDGSIAILAHVTVRLDARPNNSFDLFRFFFDPSDVS